MQNIVEAYIGVYAIIVVEVFIRRGRVRANTVVRVCVAPGGVRVHQAGGGGSSWSKSANLNRVVWSQGVAVERVDAGVCS